MFPEQTGKPRRKSCILRAWRTFLQTLGGTLSASVIAAACGLTGRVTGWRSALFILISAAVAGGIALLMNRTEE